jgi:hypothetical protein
MRKYLFQVNRNNQKNQGKKSTMKTKSTLPLIQQAALLLLLSILYPSSTRAQGTAFTYEGQLNLSGSPANGSYDLTFTLYGASTNGNLISGPVTNSATAVSNGRFTTTIDFGNVFNGNACWLLIGVRTNGNNAFVPLIPLQQITPTPYAITAENLAGAVENNTLSQGVFATLDGGLDNTVSGSYATVGGGTWNTASAYADTVAGGAFNRASSPDGSATVGGGDANLASGDSSIVAGGYNNKASGSYTTVGGGIDCQSVDSYATVGGGYNNAAFGPYDTVGGGANNSAGGQYATVAGGNGNLAQGNFSFAGGNGANALYQGDFVWADDNGGAVTSTTLNQFMVRAGGGFVFYTGTGGGGAQLAAGATAWSVLSDRNAKKDIQPANCRAVLDKLVQVPIDQWYYKWEKTSGTPNLGPMAQDFKHAFFPGRDDKSITTLEFDGVELAAIQGLNQKLNEKDTDIQQLQEQNQSLAKRLAELEQTVQSLTEKK